MTGLIIVVNVSRRLGCRLEIGGLPDASSPCWKPKDASVNPCGENEVLRLGASHTPTALQVSPYDNCAPVQDICVPIMLNCPKSGSTLQVAGISRHTSLSPAIKTARDYRKIRRGAEGLENQIRRLPDLLFLEYILRAPD